jgi:surfeit locus 1 family protein
VLRVLLSPRMVALHLLGVLAVSVAGWLGLWQYDAWQTRRAAEATDLASVPPRQLDQVFSPDDPFPGDAVGQPVDFTGVWVSESTLYVSDREYDGQDGFWVVTPAAVCDGSCDPGDPAMLVVRGWTAQPGPVPDLPPGEVELSGWLQPSEGSGRPDPDPGDDVLPEVRVADALQHVDQDLYGGYVISREATSGLAEVTPESLPTPQRFTALRNLLYALEWWVFGAFAGFVWWRWCSDEVRGVRSASSPLATSQNRDDAEVASSS